MTRIGTAMVAVAVLALSACGARANSPVDGAPRAGSPPIETADSPGGGSAECASLAGGGNETYFLGIQFLAQLRNQESVDLVRDGTVAYDPDAMEAVLDQIKGVADGFAGGSDNPGPDIDFFLEANEQARAILAVDGAVPAAMFDDMVAHAGDVSSFLGHQRSINTALSEICG